MALSIFQFLLVSWILPTEAHSVFNPTCSLPSDTVDFVSAPSTRGTLEILWGSIFTILLCTWTVQHPSIPEQRDGRNPGWKGDLRWGLAYFFERVKLFAVAIIAPEGIIAAAVNDLITARKSCWELNQQFALTDGVPWTTSHSHYVDMGGFVIRVDTEADEMDRPHHNPYHLTASDIMFLRRNNHLEKLPHITEEELDDKSKADSMLKAITIAQILWSTTQIIVRFSFHLTISLLELGVLAYSACAIITFGLYWSKPKCVRTTTTILRYPGPCIPEAVLATLKTLEPTRSLRRDFTIPPGFSRQRDHPLNSSKRKPPGSPACIDGSRWCLGHGEHQGQGEGDNDRKSVMIVTAMGVGFIMIFGAIHLAGWNFAFPSRADRMLWRCAGVYMVLYGPLIFFIRAPLILARTTTLSAVNTAKKGASTAKAATVKRAISSSSRRWRAWAVCISTHLYLVARLVILAEMVR